MWNWLVDCYSEKSLTIENMEKIMTDDREAELLWEDFIDSFFNKEKIEIVRGEVRSFLDYMKKKQGKKES